MLNSTSRSDGMQGKSSENSQTTGILSRLGAVRWWSDETVTGGDERCRTVVVVRG
jgi:hypothetical protein